MRVKRNITRPDTPVLMAGAQELVSHFSLFLQSLNKENISRLTYNAEDPLMLPLTLRISKS